MTAATAFTDPPDPARTRVLVVEDNVVNQQLLRAILDRGGYVVEVAMHGEEALELLRSHRFDAVLMDLQMPVMDGLQATREIRRPGSGVLEPGIPVIAVTASAFAADRARAIDAGMNDFLTKPLDPKRLLEALARWVPAQPAPAAVLPEVPVIDRAGLLDRAMDDVELAFELLDAFAHEYPAMRQALREAIGRADPVAIMNLVHTLKGASANVGAQRVSRVAARMEREAAAGTSTRLGDSFLELDRHLVEFERAVAALRAAGGPGLEP
jgi:CheY-like chemotaxis protein/HPt (histidine-containing phosphotransfer) domain-containing protein